MNKLDESIHHFLDGCLGIAGVTNPHLRRLASRFGDRSYRDEAGFIHYPQWTEKEWCLRFEEIWMWHEFPKCRGGCTDRKYDATKPDCQACYIVAEDKLIEQLVSGWEFPYNRWMPVGSYAVHECDSSRFNMAEVC